MYRLKKGFNNYSSFIVFICMLLTFILIQKMKSNSTQLFTISTDNDFNLIRKEFENCVKKAGEIHYYETFKFFEELNACMNAYFHISYSDFEVFSSGTNGESKVFLPMTAEFYAGDCRWLTIGMNGYTTAEKLVDAKYLNCEIFGVETEKYGNFTKIGNLLKSKLGPDDPNLHKTQKDENIKRITLSRIIMDEFIHFRLVHYLSIDMKNNEMIVMHEIIKNKKRLNDGITFCQIGAKIHNPQQNDHVVNEINRVQWILDFISEPSPYIPIFTISYNGYQTVTFVNVDNHECETAFKISSYLSEKKFL